MRALLLAALLSVGCSSPRYVQHATDAGGGRAWLTGSGGLAVFYDGQQRHQRDYPRKKSNGLYDHGTYPAARVVERDGVAFLFTRTGEVYRWEPGGWRSLDIRWKPEEDEHLQIDEAFILGDGRWAFQLHSTDFLLASHEEFLASRFHRVRLPNYFTWMGEVEGRIYGAGWDETGNGRAVLRLEAGDRWKRWNIPARTIRGVVRTPGSELAAVVDEGLMIFEREGDDISPTLRPIFGPSSYLYELLPGGRIRVGGRSQGILEVSRRGMVFWSFSSAMPVGAWSGPDGLLGVQGEGAILAGARGEIPAIREIASPPPGQTQERAR